MIVNFIIFIFLFFVVDNAYASAWLVGKNNKKIHFTLEHKDFMQTALDINDLGFAYRALYLDSNLEYGITDQTSFIYGLQLKSLWNYEIYNYDGQNGLTHQSAHKPKFSKLIFAENKLGLKQKLYQDDNNNIISFQTHSKFQDKNILELVNSLKMGRNFKLFNFPSFIDISSEYSLGLSKAPNSLALDFTLGINYSPRSMYLIQLFNNYKKNFYDHQKKNFVRNKFSDFDNKLQISHVKKINKAFRIQYGIYQNLQNKKVIKNYGIIYSMWIDL